MGISLTGLIFYLDFRLSQFLIASETVLLFMPRSLQYSDANHSVNVLVPLLVLQEPQHLAMLAAEGKPSCRYAPKLPYLWGRPLRVGTPLGRCGNKRTACRAP